MAKEQDRIDYFVEEARELLESVEQQLVALEEKPQDEEILNSIFRVFHTIKGSGSMYGYEEVAEFTHEVETLFEHLRNRELEADKGVIDLTLAAADYIKDLIFEPEEEIERSRGKQLREQLKSMKGEVESEAETGTEPEAPVQTEKTEVREEPSEETWRIYRITFKPQSDVYIRGVKILPLLQELDAMGSCAVYSHLEQVPPLEELEPTECRVGWTILLNTSREFNAIRDVFIFVEDYAEIDIAVLDDIRDLDVDEQYKRIGEILYEQGHITREDLEQLVSQTERLGEKAVKSGLLSDQELHSALHEQQLVREARKKRKEQVTKSTVRVQSSKLDKLVNLVGELVTLQAKFSQFQQDMENEYGPIPQIEEMSEPFERLGTELRDTALEIRMVPLADSFNNYHRLVRDLSGELGKAATLETEGGETELDKNVIDELNDPIVHVIRNSLDHGIETPEERRAAGKPEKGTIRLSAVHSGGNVRLTIADDGKGISVERVRARGVERGLIGKDAALSKKEAIGLLFHPGFSTSETATSVSGRGVGMDVVKKQLDRLRGKVEIDSQEGAGTQITFTIPLTLSIIDGLLLEIGGDKFVVNLSAVDECYELDDQMKEAVQSHQYLNIRGEVVPFIDLQRQLTDTQPEEGAIRQLVVVHSAERRVALIVNEILGQHQTVIKPLSKALQNVREISGSTILGDGSVALILDTNTLLEKSHERD